MRRVDTTACDVLDNYGCATVRCRHDGPQPCPPANHPVVLQSRVRVRELKEMDADMSADQDVKPSETDRSGLGVRLVEEMLRSIGRDMILHGEVDVATTTVEELRERAYRKLAALHKSGNFTFQMTVDHSDTILQDARRYASEDNVEYAFVFYGLAVEHMLNRAIRDRSFQIALTEDETIEVMRKSIHHKTGKGWTVLFGQSMPEGIVVGIRELAARRNEFMHYKWIPDPTVDMLPVDVKRQTAEAIEGAENAASSLREYIDQLLVPQDGEVFEWITRSEASSRRGGTDG